MEGAEQAELRLGLVLYGGVSLAVYIYGVVVEIQRLTRGGAKAYAEAMERAGIERAIVDVISGTSAGGINGILLAKAISTGADVSEIEDIWIEGGDIDVLLNHVDDPAPASLLATGAFGERLRDGFARLDGDGGPPDPDAVLDLFVSTTHLRGDRRGFFDDLGREITTRVHRFVIGLKLRGRYGRDDFGAEDDRLVKLARATSAFPVAFEPVQIGQADHLLGPQSEPEAWFADGGILNNKPFTEALRTIYTRSAERGPVRRWLLSVDPDPKPVPEQEGPGEQPGFDQVALAALTGIPRYQSIAADLEGLAEHNETVRRVNRAIIEMEAAVAGTGASLGVVVPAYREMRRRAWAQLAADQMIEVVRPQNPAEFDPDAVGAALGEGSLAAIAEQDDGSDLAFQRRRIYYLIKLLGMAVAEEGDEERLGALRNALWTAFETIAAVLWETLASDPLELAAPAEGEERQAAEHDRAHAVAAERVRGAAQSFAAAGADAVGPLAERLAGVSVELPLDRIDANGRALSATVSLAEVFEGFESRDFFLLSIETGGGIEFRDLVNHAQISPESASVTGVDPGKKLAGDTAGHFGGFLDPEWRRNDILWGRLDAAEIVLRAILADATAAAQDEAIEAACVEILREAAPEALETPDGDWKRYLDENAIGEVTLADVKRHRQRGLAFRAAAVMRGMLQHEAQRANGAGVEHGLRAGALGAVDDVVRRWLALPWRLARLLLRGAAKDTEKPDAPKKRD